MARTGREACSGPEQTLSQAHAGGISIYQDLQVHWMQQELGALGRRGRGKGGWSAFNVADWWNRLCQTMDLPLDHVGVCPPAIAARHQSSHRPFNIVDESASGQKGGRPWAAWPAGEGGGGGLMCLTHHKVRTAGQINRTSSAALIVPITLGLGPRQPYVADSQLSLYTWLIGMLRGSAS